MWRAVRIWGYHHEFHSFWDVWFKWDIRKCLTFKRFHYAPGHLMQLTCHQDISSALTLTCRQDLLINMSSRLWSGSVWWKERLTCHVACVSVESVLSDQFLVQLPPHSAQEVQSQSFCNSYYEHKINLLRFQQLSLINNGHFSFFLNDVVPCNILPELCIIQHKPLNIQVSSDGVLQFWNGESQQKIQKCTFVC